MKRNVYEAQGHQSPIRVMSENEAGELRVQVERIRDKQAADGINYLGVNTHYLFPTFYDLVQKKDCFR